MVVQPCITPISPREYRLDHDWTVEFELKGLKHEITVPQGYITDGASVPRILWPLVRPDGLVRAGSVLHDYLYGLRGFSAKQGFHFTRRECDIIFRDIMKECGVSWLKRGTMYNAVRLFGWLPW